jgi:two-component system, cell cycle sensor histidine kinase and response regulator CckA
MFDSSGHKRHSVDNVDLEKRIALLEEALSKKETLNKALQDSETRYRRLFETTRDGILILDAETGRIDDVNPFLLRLLGYTYAELFGQHLWELGMFKDIAASKEAFKTLQEDKSIRYEDLPLETRDGHPIAVEFVSNVYVVDQVKVIQCNIRDITERVRLKTEVQHAKEYAENIVETVREPLVVLTSDLKMLTANHSFYETFRVTPAETIGHFIYDLGNKQWDIPKLRVLFEEILPNVTIFNGYEVEHDFPDIGRKVFLLNARGIFRENMSSHIILLAMEDITERKAIDQLLRDVQRREAIAVLSAGIAHDFNNLLAVMMGNISLAELQLASQHPALKYMKNALTAMESAAELTKQILAYSGKGKNQISRIDLRSEIHEQVKLFKISMPPNVKMTAHLPSTPIYVNGDAGQIRQIIMNLIINGGDAIGDKDGVVSVMLGAVSFGTDELAQYNKFTNTTLTEGCYALLEVSDSGIGMCEDTIKSIFDPFFTTKFVGRGLGLSAVLGIIRGHEGGIAIESTEGKGTTFRILLPAHTTIEAGNDLGTEDNSPASQTAITVLVIDDEPEVATMAKEILETGSYTVLVELNPIKGIEVYREHRSEVGVVLLDLTMPEMSGKDVVDALQTINPDVKIILSSGYTESEVHKKVDMAKVSGFLQKPYPLQLLLTMMQKVMRMIT